ncbi:MAG TPA: TlpA disulfide reductase family protein [Terriglobales bacterium]|jgi:thiol-disulfide isomerase/thioredoxin
MRKLPLPVFLFVALVTTACFGQSSPVPSDGLDLLKRIGQHYADAKSYHLKVVEESTGSTELQRTWDKELIEAAESPGNRFYYVGRSGWGGALRISDGQTSWTFRTDELLYTKTRLDDLNPNAPRFFRGADSAEMRAESLRRSLANLAREYKSATRLANATLEIEGRQVPCFVIHVGNSDMNRNPAYSLDETIWVDQDNLTVVRTVLHANGNLFPGSAVSRRSDVITTYVLAELDRPVPDLLFVFSPPAGARLIDKFPDPTQSGGGPSLEGQMFPDIKMTASDGKTISTESLRGKPVVLDIWATWCAPCIKGLEQLAEIRQRTNDKDLVIMTIDQDEVAKTASDFLAKKGYSWPNLHDDGSASKALGGINGIPRSILVDGTGKVILDRTDANSDSLLKAIAALGPNYAELAPKEPQPCGANTVSSK